MSATSVSKIDMLLTCCETGDGFHFVTASDDEGRTLVRLCRSDVEDALCSVCGCAAGLLGDHGERVGLVEQAKLTVWSLCRRWIEEDAALEQRAVEVGDERADVARGVFCAKQCAIAKTDDRLLVGGREVGDVRFVRRVIRPLRRHLHLFPTQDEA